MPYSSLTRQSLRVPDLAIGSAAGWHRCGRPPSLVTSNRKTANPCWLNTLIIFVAGDNGMSAEGSFNGTPNEVGYFNDCDYSVEQMLPLIPV